MNVILVNSLLASLLVSLVSLVGAFALFLKERTLKNSLQFLMSLAVGVLLGDAFLHLIPDAITRIGDMHSVLVVTVGGILLFFFLEKIIRWKHRFYAPSFKSVHAPQPLAKMNLVGDAVHNFIDGTLIAGSFMASPALGVTTTLAIIIHEIPQEVGDIGALIHGGYSPKQAVWYNFLCSLTCTAGVLTILLLGSFMVLPLNYLLPIAAGGFIYIASTDLIPELHNKAKLHHQLAQGVVISIGVLCMVMITIIEEMLFR